METVRRAMAAEDLVVDAGRVAVELGRLVSVTFSLVLGAVSEKLRDARGMTRSGSLDGTKVALSAKTCMSHTSHSTHDLVPPSDDPEGNTWLSRMSASWKASEREKAPASFWCVARGLVTRCMRRVRHPRCSLTEGVEGGDAQLRRASDSWFTRAEEPGRYLLHFCR